MVLSIEVLGLIIPVFLALLTLAYGYGVLSTKVRGNRKDLDSIYEEFKEYQRENKSDHNIITGKLDRILLNGKHS